MSEPLTFKEGNGLKFKYVVTCGFCTDGDFSVFPPLANLEKSLDSEYDLYGAFVINDRFDVIDQLCKIVSAIEDNNGVILRWAIEEYGLAINGLRNVYDSPFIFHAQYEGNYSGTFLHIQTIPQEDKDVNKD